MVCVVLLICLLVMVEVECYLLDVVMELEGLFVKYGLEEDSVIFCVIGCLNGCGCVMLFEVGLVGKGLGKYNLYLGGN